MRILGIDPGETTGFAVFDVERWMLEDNGGWVSVTRAFEEVEWWLMETGVDVIVCEDYLIYAHKRDAQIWSRPCAIEVIGVARFLSARWNAAFVLQRAVERTFFGSERDPKKYEAGNLRLRTLGFWLDNKHARDAMRHVLTYLLAQKDAQLLAELQRIQPALLAAHGAVPRRSRK